jgi:hypothetical protein
MHASLIKKQWLNLMLTQLDEEVDGVVARVLSKPR